jgi:hypothetical protein
MVPVLAVQYVLFGVKVEHFLQQIADEYGVYMVTRDEIMNVLRELEVSDDQKSPLELIDSESGEIMVDKGDRFIDNSYYREAHGIRLHHRDELQKKWDEEEVDDYDLDVYVRGNGFAYIEGFEEAYDVTMQTFGDFLDDPEEMERLGYDIYASVPISIRRVDGKMFNDTDVKNIKKYVKTYNNYYDGQRALLLGVLQTDILYVELDVTMS